MTEEEKAAAEAEAKEAEAKVAAEGEKAPLQNNADIEAALKSERERREKAESELEETRRKAKERIEKKRQEGQEGNDEPLTRDSLRQVLDEERETVRKEMREERVRELAKKLSKSDSEVELVIEVWKNRTLAGTLDEQIEEAFAIATHKRTQAQNSELKRALGSKDGIITDGSNTQRKPLQGNAPELPANDKQAVAGMIWDNARGAYRKIIAGGRKVFFVSKDLKRRWTEDAPKK